MFIDLWRRWESIDPRGPCGERRARRCLGPSIRRHEMRQIVAAVAKIETIKLRPYIGLEAGRNSVVDFENRPHRISASGFRRR